MRYKMYLVAWTIALTVLFYVTSHSRAADYSVRFGPGLRDGQPTGTTKMFGLRREAYQFYGIYFAQELGGYVENGGGGKRGAALAKFQVGTSPGPDTGLFAKAFVGPCVISATDVLLGGHGQFCTDAGIGIRDRMTFVAVLLSHISSAGLAQPNRGRDYALIETGVRF